MDVNLYMQRLEESVNDPERLEQLREQATADGTLLPEDRGAILGRAGRYLGDLQGQPDGGWEPGAEPEERD